MMRITDHLLENLFQDVKDLDDPEKVKVGLKTYVGELPPGH